MSNKRQKTLFSFLNVTKPDNFAWIKNIVFDIIDIISNVETTIPDDNVVFEIIDSSISKVQSSGNDTAEHKGTSQKRKSNTDEYNSSKKARPMDQVMTAEKIETWKKNLIFWDTADGKPSPGKKVTWLEVDTESEHFSCWVCKQYPKLANENNAVTNSCNKWHKNYPQRHHDDIKHKDCIDHYLKERHGKIPELEKSLKVASSRSVVQFSKDLESLFHTAYYIVKEGLALRKFESLCMLQQLNGLPLRGDNYKNINACKRFISSMADDYKLTLRDSFNNARFISILSDGSTDKEEEVVYVRYVENGSPITCYAGIGHPVTVDAEGLKNCILKVVSQLSEKDVNKQDEYLKSQIFPRLVNVNFDGASVMSGRINGVQAKIKAFVPGLVYSHCVAHKLELAVLDSLKDENSYLTKFDETLNGIFRFYYYSTVRRDELKELAKLFDEEFKQLGLMKNIRWIASRMRALNLMECNYKIIVFDLEQKSHLKSDTGKKALGYLTFIKKPKFLFFLHFLQDLVGALKPVSLKFQQDSLLACEIPRIVSELKSKIDSLDVIRGENSDRLLENISLEEEHLVYKTITLESLGNHRSDEENRLISTEEYAQYFEKKFFSNILSQCNSFLSQRYQDFEVSPLKEIVKIFDFKKWPKSFSDNKKWGIDEVQFLAEYYLNNSFITVEESKLAAREWFVFRTKASRFNQRDSLLHVYRDLMIDKDDISNFVILLDIMMSMSSSTASCERGFSCMNRQKTNLRTGLAHDTLDDIMRLCISGPSIENFEPSPHVDKWMSAGNRHLAGHKTKRTIDKNSETRS